MNRKYLGQNSEIQLVIYNLLCLIIDEHDNKESEEVSEHLENIDGEIENLDITFVKMADTRYARKWGVTKLPAIVYFRKRFPSIYRGEKNCQKFDDLAYTKNKFVKLHM